MPFYFTCPYCHLRTLVDDRFAGSTGPCADCAKTVTIPGRIPEAIDLSPPVRKLNTRKELIRLAIQITASLAIILAILGVSAAIVIPALEQARKGRNRSLCLNNMRQIVNALNAYAKEHGTYPPPAVLDSKGKPLYSWRVLILPQLGFDGLYGQFILDQPWDSPTNLSLFKDMPDVFASPGSPDAKAVSESNYVLLTGIGSLFPKTGPMSPKQITDDPAQTILLAETTNSRMKWTEPGDIDASLGITLGNRPRIDIGGNHQDGINVVAADGTPMVLPTDISSVVVDAMKTPNGGERIDTSSLKP